MNALVVYYSRTGMTKIVAETVRALLQCDAEELKDTKKRKGLVGYMRSGREVMEKGTTTLEPTSRDPADYDLVIVGTPVWVYTMSTPVKAWLEQNEAKIKKLAVFCTCGSDPGHTIEDVEAACGLVAGAKLVVLARIAKRAMHVEETTEFVRKLQA
ncbi:MAG: flavodoxin [Methanobacteriota archaeon]